MASVACNVLVTCRVTLIAGRLAGGKPGTARMIPAKHAGKMEAVPGVQSCTFPQNLRTTAFSRMNAQFGFEAFNDNIKTDPNSVNVSTQNILPRQIQVRLKFNW